MGIVVTDLTKTFDDKTLFSNLSFALGDTGLVRITGPSGVGKTTLLRIIAGIDKDFSGSVDRDGDISYLFQEHRLLPWLSALDNVIVASFNVADESDKESVRALLYRLGFSDNELLRKPSKLSGGMKQRIALARALARRSDILLLDEPTKELDSSLVSTVADIIREESNRRLVIFVSHDPLLDTVEVNDLIRLSRI